MLYTVPQHFPEQLFEIGTPSREDIESEPVFRRASADFVRRSGGAIARKFIDSLDRLGLVEDSSRFLCQKSPIVEGAYAVPPNWHIDRMPGTQFNLREHLSEPIQGVIACICTRDKPYTTEFLHNGSVVLDEPEQTEAFHRPGEYVAHESGIMNWTTHQIDAQLEAGRVALKVIEPNHGYKYDSTFYHKAPRFPDSGGYRMILRVNTPPPQFRHAVATEDVLLDDQRAYFVLDESGQRWHKHLLSA